MCLFFLFLIFGTFTTTVLRVRLVRLGGLVVDGCAGRRCAWSGVVCGVVAS